MKMELDSSSKKAALEELSKEELIKKCRGLLNIAQKAKQAKDLINEENQCLKEKLAKHEKEIPNVKSALEELIESLTQQKLTLVTQLEEFKNQKGLADNKLKQCEFNLSTAEQAVNELDNENQSYKRQIKRLGDENEQLIIHLDTLEKEIEVLRKLGLQQQNQLLELEKNNRTLTDINETINRKFVETHVGANERNVKLQKAECSKKENSNLSDKLNAITEIATGQDKNIAIISDKLSAKAQRLLELQKELTRIQEENTILKASEEKLSAENLKLIDQQSVLLQQNKNLEESIEKSENIINDLKKQVKLKTEQVEIHLSKTDDLNIELHKNKALVEKLKQDISNTSIRLSNSQIVSSGVTSDLQNTNERLRERLKFYHSKIVKFAGDIKLIRQDRNEVLNSFKIYTKQVETWKAQLAEISKCLQSGRINCDGNCQLKMENDEYKSKIKVVEEQINNLEAVNATLKENLSQTEELNSLKSENAALLEKLDNHTEEIQQLKGNLAKVQEEKQILDNTIKLTAEEHSNEIKHFKDRDEKEIDNLKVKVQTLVQELNLKKENIAELNQRILSLQQLEAECTNYKEENSNLSDKLNSISQIASEQDKNIAIINDKLSAKVQCLEELQEELTRIQGENDILKTSEEKLSSENSTLYERQSLLLQQVKSLEETIEKSENIIGDLKRQVEEKTEQVKTELGSYKEENDKLIELKEKLTIQIMELENNIQEYVNTNQQLNKANCDLNKQLDLYKSTECQLAEESRKEITKLVQENQDLTEINKDLQHQLSELKNAIVQQQKADSYSQTAEVTQISELEERLSVIKRENSELLTEMNEMNQALKERGETISKQQEYCEEVVRKLKLYETQMNKSSETAQQKDEQIKRLQQEIAALTNQSQLQDSETVASIRSELNQKNEEVQELQQELSKLKEKLSSTLETSSEANYAESDVLSTSTISKTEEANRLKDLEGSWEERYGKLRTLAIKLKGKIRDLTAELAKEQNEKAEVQQKLANNLKTIQTLQSQNDELNDRIDYLKNDIKNYIKNLDLAAQEISNNKKQLALYDENISKLKSDIDGLSKEKTNTDNWKKQVGAKVQNLKKELEANVLVKKDFENQIAKLNSELEAKEKSLKDEIEKHNQTRCSLQELNSECKKQSLLSLEMQDYERSLIDLTQKLDKKQELVTKLKNQIDSQKSTTNAIKEQNRLLEERLQNEETDLKNARNEINAYKKNLSDVETIIAQKEEKILDITRTLETTRSENEELSTQLSKIITEHQKINATLKSEKDYLRSQNLGLEQRLRETQEKLKLKEDELRNIQSEYEGYRVRAQSVLRQNQTRDVGLEEKLLEEAASFKAQVDVLTQELEDLKLSVSQLTSENKKLTLDRESFQTKCQDLEAELQEHQKRYAELSLKHQQASVEYTESIRGLKVHADTLAQCYRKQISEQEVRHNREIIELQSKLDQRGSAPPELPGFVVPSMPREEGEGSENNDVNVSSTVQPIPLEKLLNSESDQDASVLRKQLIENDAKVTHLTALLADTEQDLVKHVQMNKVLKEEIRRQQRSVEREKHAENLEYLKNVVFKFITLSGGDERTRLVPVLNTILKLSPEETQKLNMVAKGDPSVLGWANYLPLWSSPNK